ncbi:hypothetical protein ACFQVA_25915 [Actinomadura keratinilytica]
MVVGAAAKRRAGRGLALGSALECAVEGVGFAEGAGLPVGIGVLLGVVAGSVLVVRRRWPVAVVLVAIAITPAEMGFLLATVGLYTLAASQVPRRIIGVTTGMSLAATLIVTLMRTHQGVGDIAAPGSTCGSCR